MATTITGFSVANPTVVTQTTHNMTDGMQVYITGSNSTPSCDGFHTITYVGANSYTIPVNVTNAGSTGRGQRVFFIDPEGGTDAGKDGKTFANRWKTLAAFTAAIHEPGDFVKVMASDMQDTTVHATWTDTSRTVTLAGAVTTNLCDCETAGTAVNSAAVTREGAYNKEGTYGAKVVTTTSTGDKEWCKWDIGSTLDLSGYQQISFWVRNETLAVAANELVIKLYDNTSPTPLLVETLTLALALAATARWQPVTINKGSNLSSTVRWISIWYNNPTATTKTFYFDNFIACKAASAADCLTLNSLIGKNSSTEKMWWPIKSINGTTVMIDQETQQLAGAGKGFAGTSEECHLWRVQPALGLITSSVSTAFWTLPESATSFTDYSCISCGWDRTDMSTLPDNSITALDNYNGNGYGINFSSYNYWTLKRLLVARSYTGIRISSIYGAVIEDCYGVGAVQNGIATSLYTTALTMTRCYSQGAGMGITCARGTATDLYAMGCATGFQFTGDMLVNNITCRNNTSGLLVNIGKLKIIGTQSFKDNTNYDLYIYEASTIISRGATYPSSTPTSGIAFGDGRIYLMDYQGTAGDHRIYTDYGYLKHQATTVHTGGGNALALYCTATQRQALYPLWHTIRTAVVAANAQVTCTAWLQRSNTGLSVGLRVRANQLAGVNETISLMTNSENTWQQVTLQFTPTEAGYIDIDVIAYGGTSYIGYCDDVAMTQA